MTLVDELIKSKKLRKSIQPQRDREHTELFIFLYSQRPL